MHKELKFILVILGGLVGVWLLRLYPSYKEQSTSTFYSHKPPSNKELKLLLQPVFETSLDLLRAIDMCLMERPGRCHVLHLTPTGIYIDNATATAPRLDHVLEHLNTLQIKNNMTMALYTADTLPSRMAGLPIVTHTTGTHKDFLLFPTPYLLRNLYNGELESVLSYCNSVKFPFHSKRPVVYFRGRYRNKFRVDVAKHASNLNHKKNINQNKSDIYYDVQFVDVPPNEWNASMLTQAKLTDWTDKLQYQYLLTLSGGWSSQWEVYRDFVAGGVIVRFANDKREYWNYDILDTENVVNVKSLEALGDTISRTHNKQRNQTEAMAAATKSLACQRLQPRQIELYSQEFLDQYMRRFSNMVNHQTTYNLQEYKSWKPSLVDTATLVRD